MSKKIKEWTRIPGFDTPTPVVIELTTDGSYHCKYRPHDNARNTLDAEYGGYGTGDTPAAAKSAYVSHVMSVLRST